jgi:class 3 adenylate cyclase
LVASELAERKLAAILATDVVGYSKLAGADEERTLARLRTLRSDLIDPTVSVHRGRTVKRTGDGALIEFRSVVDAVRCAIEMQNGLVERNAGLPPERRIEFRMGIHLGDVVEEPDGDLMGDGVNITARLEGVAKPGAIYLSEDAYRQVRARLDMAVSDLGAMRLKNIAEPVRVYALEVGKVSEAKNAGRRRRGPAPFLAILAALLVAGALAAWYFTGSLKSADSAAPQRAAVGGSTSEPAAAASTVTPAVAASTTESTGPAKSQSDVSDDRVGARLGDSLLAPALGDVTPPVRPHSLLRKAAKPKPPEAAAQQSAETRPAAPTNPEFAPAPCGKLPLWENDDATGQRAFLRCQKP